MITISLHRRYDMTNRPTQISVHYQRAPMEQIYEATGLFLYPTIEMTMVDLVVDQLMGHVHDQEH